MLPTTRQKIPDILIHIWNLAQDRDRWRGIVNAVMKLWVPDNEEHFLTG